MCGRFKVSQLDDFNFNDWQGQTSQTFQAKFILTLFLVFGLTLFSCKTLQKPNQKPELNLPITAKKIDSTAHKLAKQDTIASDLNNIVSRPFWEDDITIGLIPLALVQTKVNKDCFLTGFTTLVEHKEVMNGIHTMGNIDYIRDYPIAIRQAYLTPTLPLNKIIPLKFEDSSTLISGTNKNYASLNINVAIKEKYNISIYGEKGKFLHEISGTELNAGLNSFNVDLNKFGSGQFYIGIVTKTKHEIIQFKV
jgi:hypothetical protein